MPKGFDGKFQNTGCHKRAAKQNSLRDNKIINITYRKSMDNNKDVNKI